jgi:hypothetical protein
MFCNSKVIMKLEGEQRKTYFHLELHYDDLLSRTHVEKINNCAFISELFFHGIDTKFEINSLIYLPYR